MQKITLAIALLTCSLAMAKGGSTFYDASITAGTSGGGEATLEGAATGDIDMSGFQLVDTSGPVTVGSTCSSSHSLTVGDSVFCGAAEINGAFYADGAALFADDVTLASGANLYMGVAAGDAAASTHADTVIDIQRDGGAALVMSGYGGTGSAPFILGRRAEGTQASPTALLNGRTLFGVVGNGHDGTGFTTDDPASMLFITSGTWSDTSHGTSWQVTTTAQGTTTPVVGMQLNNAGNLGVGMTTTAPSARLHVRGTTTDGSTNILRLDDSAGTARLTVTSAGAATFAGNIVAGNINQNLRTSDDVTFGSVRGGNLKLSANVMNAITGNLTLSAPDGAIVLGGFAIAQSDISFGANKGLKTDSDVGIYPLLRVWDTNTSDYVNGATFSVTSGAPTLDLMAATTVGGSAIARTSDLANGNSAYASRITTATSPLAISGQTISISPTPTFQSATLSRAASGHQYGLIISETSGNGDAGLRLSTPNLSVAFGLDQSDGYLLKLTSTTSPNATLAQTPIAYWDTFTGDMFTRRDITVGRNIVMNAGALVDNVDVSAVTSTHTADIANHETRIDTLENPTSFAFEKIAISENRVESTGTVGADVNIVFAPNTGGSIVLAGGTIAQSNISLADGFGLSSDQTAGSSNPFVQIWNDGTSEYDAFLTGAVNTGAVGTLTLNKNLAVASGVTVDTVDISELAADVAALEASSGTGDVVGPASATDNAVTRFDSTTGKLVQNSSATIDDSGNIATNGDITATGGDITLVAENVLSCSGTTCTLKVIDSIDSGTETTLETAIDTLLNVTQVGPNTYGMFYNNTFGVWGVGASASSSYKLRVGGDFATDGAINTNISGAYTGPALYIQNQNSNSDAYIQYQTKWVEGVDGSDSDAFVWSPNNGVSVALGQNNKMRLSTAGGLSIGGGLTAASTSTMANITSSYQTVSLSDTALQPGVTIRQANGNGDASLRYTNTANGSSWVTGTYGLAGSANLYFEYAANTNAQFDSTHYKVAFSNTGAVSATSYSGTILTASQPSITSIGANLSGLASSTSAQAKALINDEVGNASGKVLFATSGEYASWVATNGTVSAGSANWDSAYSSRIQSVTSPLDFTGGTLSVDLSAYATSASVASGYYANAAGVALDARVTDLEEATPVSYSAGTGLTLDTSTFRLSNATQDTLTNAQAAYDARITSATLPMAINDHDVALYYDAGDFELNGDDELALLDDQMFSSVTIGSGGNIRTQTSASDKAWFQAYNTGTSEYANVAWMTAGTSPALTLATSTTLDGASIETASHAASTYQPIGSYQASSSVLSSIAGLSASNTDQIVIGAGSGTYALTGTLSTLGKNWLTVADASAGRAALSLGTSAIRDEGYFYTFVQGNTVADRVTVLENATDENTTYTPGDGLKLTGTEFAISNAVRATLDGLGTASTKATEYFQVAGSYQAANSVLTALGNSSPIFQNMADDADAAEVRGTIGAASAANVSNWDSAYSATQSYDAWGVSFITDNSTDAEARTDLGLGVAATSDMIGSSKYVVATSGAPYTSIQSAIDACLAAETETYTDPCVIVVKGGSYSENITLYASVSLVGIGGSWELRPVIVGKVTANYGSASGPYQATATLNNFRISSPSGDYAIDFTGSSAQSLYLSNVSIYKGTGTGKGIRINNSGSQSGLTSVMYIDGLRVQGGSGNTTASIEHSAGRVQYMGNVRLENAGLDPTLVISGSAVSWQTGGTIYAEGRVTVASSGSNTLINMLAVTTTTTSCINNTGSGTLVIGMLGCASPLGVNSTAPAVDASAGVVVYARSTVQATNYATAISGAFGVAASDPLGLSLQSKDATLTSIAAVSSTNTDKLLIGTGSDTWGLTSTLGTFGKSWLTTSDAAAGRTNLGLGTSAVRDEGYFYTFDQGNTVADRVTVLENATDENTTYTAGDGLKLESTTFALANDVRAVIDGLGTASTKATEYFQIAGSYQAANATLTSLAASATSYGITFASSADAAAARSSLALGTAATTASSDYLLAASAGDIYTHDASEFQAAGSYQAANSVLTALSISSAIFQSMADDSDATAVRATIGAASSANVSNWDSAYAATQSLASNYYANAAGVALDGRITALEGAGSASYTFGDGLIEAAGDVDVDIVSTSLKFTGGQLDTIQPIAATSNVTFGSINNVAITAPASTATLTIASGRTATISNTLTFTGTDASTVNVGSGGTVVYTSNNISALANSTSLQVKTLVQDETGSGALVFASAPSISSATLNSPTINSGTGTSLSMSGQVLGAQLVATTNDTGAGTIGVLQQNGSGDTQLRWDITGRQYGLGIDNSDSDKLVLATATGSGTVLGTNNLLTITSAGLLTTTGDITITGGDLTVGSSPALSDSAGNLQLQNIDSLDATTTATIGSAFTSFSGLSSITMATGGSFRTGTAANNTALLQSYDVDGASYTTFGTLTAGNTPTLALSPTSLNVSYSDSATTAKMKITQGGAGDSFMTWSVPGRYYGMGIQNSGSDGFIMTSTSSEPTDLNSGIILQVTSAGAFSFGGAVSTSQLNVTSTSSGGLTVSNNTSSTTPSHGVWSNLNATGMVATKRSVSTTRSWAEGLNGNASGRYEWATANSASAVMGTGTMMYLDTSGNLTTTAGLNATGLTLTASGAIMSDATTAHTLKIQGWDVDGAARVDVLTVTNGNSVGADLSSIVTIGGQAIVNNSSGLNALSSAEVTQLNAIGTSDISATEWGYVASMQDVASGANVSFGNIAGTLTTGAQTGITSVGTLGDVSVSGAATVGSLVADGTTLDANLLTTTGAGFGVTAAGHITLTPSGTNRVKIAQANTGHAPSLELLNSTTGGDASMRFVQSDASRSWSLGHNESDASFQISTSATTNNTLGSGKVATWDTSGTFTNFGAAGIQGTLQINSASTGGDLMLKQVDDTLTHGFVIEDKDSSQSYRAYIDTSNNLLFQSGSTTRMYFAEALKAIKSGNGTHFEAVSTHLTIGSAATTIAGVNNFHTLSCHASGNSLATLTGYSDGATVVIKTNNPYCIFVDGDGAGGTDSFNMRGAATNYAAPEGVVITFVHMDGSWHEAARSENL